MIKVLAIGDTANNVAEIRKFIKKSQITLINFPRKGPALFTYYDDVEFFNSLKISKQVQKINEIKHNFDICIAMSWAGARIAYLADINYIMYFVGGDIVTPPFMKNPTLPYLQKPLRSFNAIERWFYKNVFHNAVACVTINDEYFNHLKMHRKDAMRLDRILIDINLFNQEAEPIKIKKTKFTFFSPQRNGPEKGMDLLWESLRLCKSDFDVIMIDWFDDRTEEEKLVIKKLIEKKPPQVRFIPMIKRKDMPSFYRFADAVIGQMRAGIQGGIEREAVMCGKAVVHYSDPNRKIILDGEEINPPYLPHSNDPKEIAFVIDNVVESKEFRDKLFNDEYKFVMNQCDPVKAGRDWDDLFEKISLKHKSINHGSFVIKIKILNFISFIAETFWYVRTMKERNIKAWGKEEYERLMK